MIFVEENESTEDSNSQFPHRKVIIKRRRDVRTAFKMHHEIGRGKFGRVLKCQDVESGEYFAAKFVICTRKEDKRNFEREIEIMNGLNHPLLLQLYDAYDNGNTEMCIVTEYIGGGELFDRVIEDEFVLTEKACIVFMKQILIGVAYLHSQHIVHLDLKPENILCLTKSGNQIKIIDFGLARKYEPRNKLQILFGTPEFVAPEVVNFEPISYATDMWSLGVISYVLLSGLSPFMGDTDLETMANVTISDFDYDDEAFDNISEIAKDFINHLLIKEQEQRSSAQNALKHPWILSSIKKDERLISKDKISSYKKDNDKSNYYMFDGVLQTIVSVHSSSIDDSIVSNSSSQNYLTDKFPKYLKRNKDPVKELSLETVKEKANQIRKSRQFNEDSCPSTHSSLDLSLSQIFLCESYHELPIGDQYEDSSKGKSKYSDHQQFNEVTNLPISTIPYSPSKYSDDIQYEYQQLYGRTESIFDERVQTVKFGNSNKYEIKENEAKSQVEIGRDEFLRNYSVKGKNNNIQFNKEMSSQINEVSSSNESLLPDHQAVILTSTLASSSSSSTNSVFLTKKKFEKQFSLSFPSKGSWTPRSPFIKSDSLRNRSPSPVITGVVLRARKHFEERNKKSNTNNKILFT